MPKTRDDYYVLFTPTLNMPKYSLHRWKMRGTRMVDCLSIEDFRCERYVFITGRLEPVPPQEVIDRVDSLLKTGAEVNVPFGWRTPLKVAAA